MAYTQEELEEMLKRNPEVRVVNPALVREVGTFAQDMPGGKTNKYHALRTYSTLIGRWFASKGEARRAEELTLMQKAGIISDLKFQVPFTLSQTPRVRIVLDFTYHENGHQVYEDFKGVLLDNFRTKLAWLKAQTGIEVILTKG